MSKSEHTSFETYISKYLLKFTKSQFTLILINSSIGFDLALTASKLIKITSIQRYKNFVQRCLTLLQCIVSTLYQR